MTARRDFDETHILPPACRSLFLQVHQHPPTLLTGVRAQHFYGRNLRSHMSQGQLPCSPDSACLPALHRLGGPFTLDHELSSFEVVRLLVCWASWVAGCAFLKAFAVGIHMSSFEYLCTGGGPG